MALRHYRTFRWSRPPEGLRGAGAIVAAVALDRLLGEPPEILHPVVWIGRAAARLERLPRSSPLVALVGGAGGSLAIVGASALAGWGASRLIRRLPPPLGILAEGWLLGTLLSVRALLAAGEHVRACLEADDLPAARAAVRALVSRSPAGLDASLLASAAIESLAENTADSIVAPLLAYAVGGLPAAFAYRAVNTLDAMIGYHGEYEYLGKVAARLDDLANLLPARVSAALLLVAGALGGGDGPGGLLVMAREHGATESPNAGWPMAAMAGLLGTRLEKPGHYVLGQELPAPDLPAIDQAAELVNSATGLAVILALAVHRARSTLMYPGR